MFPEDQEWSVERIMHREPLAVSEDETVLEVCSLMNHSKTGQVMVVPREWKPRPGELPPEPLGIFTERDLIRAVVEHREKLPDLKMADVMTAPCMTMDLHEGLQHAFNLMLLLRVRRLPVIDKGRLVGLVTRGRVMEAQRQRVAKLEADNQSLEEQLVHDPLTGLANRVLFQQVIDREIKRFERHGGHLGLLMLDIDHFKRVNDTYGHLTGDVVLRQVTSVLRETVRTADLLARIGGEEFAVIISQRRKPDLHRLADKLRKRVEEETYGEGNVRLNVTISIGAKFYEKGMGGRSDLMKKADENLYQAKQTGRNKTVGP